MEMHLTRFRVPIMTAAQVAEELRTPPAVRGFWTDEELLHAAGLGSVAMVRKLLTSKWLWADQVSIEGGGRRRAWTFREVCRAAATVEIAEVCGLSVQAAAAILSRLGSDWFDQALDIKARALRVLGEEVEAPETGQASIYIVDATDIWIEVQAGLLELRSHGAKLSGADFAVPVLRDIWIQRCQLSELMARARAVTIISLPRLNLGFTSEAREQRDAWAQVRPDSARG